MSADAQEAANDAATAAVPVANTSSSTAEPSASSGEVAAPTATTGATGGTANAPSAPPAPLPSAAEFEPPLACVRRILKHALPSSTNVGKDASAAFARASGIFIIYITACANDFARENKRQTITANDVLAAVTELDFDEFTPDMLSFLESYRSAEKNKKSAKAAAVAAKQGLANVPSPVSAADGNDGSPTATKLADDLSDDEADEEDANATADGTKEDAVVVTEATPLLAGSDRKRPRPEDDETDSEGGDENEDQTH